MTSLPCPNAAGTHPCNPASSQERRAPLLPHHEFWPSWLFYLPLLPYLLFLALRHRHPLAFLVANPGIENAGGWIDESKFKIAQALSCSGAPQLRSCLIPAGLDPTIRAGQASAMIFADPRMHFPVILKPDRAQRGYGVKLARSHADLLPYFAAVRGDVILQQYHPGPNECGILWVREQRPIANRGAHPVDTAGDGSPTSPPSLSSRQGAILSITRKTFPVLQGDGFSTLEQLIRAHARFRMQAPVFLTRHAHQLTRVLSKGETLRLAEAGNHCQGTRFSDGSDLITPELSAAIDRICATYPGPTGEPGGLDFGRFDIRYESDELLRQGRGFAIVELNGTSAEATALYDPERSLLWSYRLLFRQWRALFAVGAARLRQGHRPARLRDLWRLTRGHYRDRSGPSIAD